MTPLKVISFKTPAEAIAWANGNAPDVTWESAQMPAVGQIIQAGGIAWRYIGTGTAIPNMPGWVPDGIVHVAHFGAVQDYDDETGTGTDDTAAFTAAFAYAGGASPQSDDQQLSTVWYDGPCAVTKITPLRGTRLMPTRPASSVGQGQTAGSVFPQTYREGSKLVGTATSGPVIHINASNVHIGPVTIGSTSSRQSAVVSTGAGGTNCGILIETADTASVVQQRVTIDSAVIRDQPADGIYGCGDWGMVTVQDVHIYNCGRHGIVFDNGALSGRTNKGRPGQINILRCRPNNLGGHILCIGHPAEAANQPYRVTIENTEGFRSGNTPAHLHSSAGFYILGEQVTIEESAPSGTSGTSGNTPTLDYAAWCGGRGITWRSCRFIQYATNPVAIGVVSGLGTVGVHFISPHAATDATLPVNFAVVEGTVTGLRVTEPSGDFTGDPVDHAVALAFSTTTASGQWVYKQELAEWGIKRERQEIKNSRSYRLSIADDAATSITFNGTTCNFVAIITGSVDARGTVMISGRVGTSPYIRNISSGGATIGTGTTALTGTTGTDAQLNLACVSDGKLYIENRTGVTGTYTVQLLAVNWESGEAT